MIKETTFCEECRTDVAYKEFEIMIQNELKCDIYEYRGKKAICDKCGSEVYVAEIEDYNLMALYDAYRKKFNLKEHLGMIISADIEDDK